MFFSQTPPAGPRTIVLYARPYPRHEVASILTVAGASSFERPLDADCGNLISEINPDLVIVAIATDDACDRQIQQLAIPPQKLLMFTPNGSSRTTRLPGLGCYPDTAIPIVLARTIRSIAGGNQANLMTVEERTLVAGSLQIDLAALRATISGKDIALTRREFLMLATFVEHHGRLLRSVEILNSVDGHLRVPDNTSHSVKVYVNRIRKKLQAAGANDVTITNIRGFGYRWDPLESTCRHASLSIL